MTEPINTSDILLARLAQGLDSTAKMTEALLSDLRESETDFAAMKTELVILKENVKGLSELIKDGGTSALITRAALIEQNIKNIKKWVDSHVSVHQNVKKDIVSIDNHIKSIESRMIALESMVNDIIHKEREKERAKRISIDREIDFEYEVKKTNEKIKVEKEKAISERKSIIFKIAAGILATAVGLGAGYVAKTCDITPSKTEIK
jgi:seryl-tRNA synthetase